MPKIKYTGKVRAGGFDPGQEVAEATYSVPFDWLNRHFEGFVLIPDEPKKQPKKPEEKKREQVTPAVTPSLSAKKD